MNSLIPGYFALLMLVGAAAGKTVPCTGPFVKKMPVKPVVEISLAQKTIHVCDRSKPRECEWASATFRITNCGSSPFYIPQTMANDEWHGGFEDIFTGSFGRNGPLREQGAADYGADYHPDVLKEIQESWMLLMPGEFYGGTMALRTAPTAPGVYKVIGRHVPPQLSDEIKANLSTLKFPVLLEPVDSEPLYLKVVK